jgi:hypothetical protein
MVTQIQRGETAANGPQPKGAGISARTVTGFLPLKHQHLFTL